MKAFLNDLKIAVHVPWRGIDVCGQPFSHFKILLLVYGFLFTIALCTGIQLNLFVMFGVEKEQLFLLI